MSSPRTWNEAADDAADEIISTWNAQPRTLDGDLFSDITEAADRMRLLFEQPQGADLATVYRREASFMAHRALTLQARKLSQPQRLVAHNIATLACTKHHDYGTGNITLFGVRGLIVRTSDKVERLKNLLRRGSEGASEPLVDAYADIVGYAIVGMMFVDGNFTLPLFEDLPARYDEQRNPALAYNREFSELIRDRDAQVVRGTELRKQAERSLPSIQSGVYEAKSAAFEPDPQVQWGGKVVLRSEPLQGRITDITFNDDIEWVDGAAPVMQFVPHAGAEMVTFPADQPPPQHCSRDCDICQKSALNALNFRVDL